MGAPTITPRCRFCERTWLQRYGWKHWERIEKMGFHLELTGRRRARRKTSSGKYVRAAEVRCLDCGHTWWTVHPQLVGMADKKEEKGGD